MKRSPRTFAILAIIFIIISNTPPAQYLFLEKYSYQNKDGSFTYQEEPGSMDFEVGEIRWERFKNEHPNDPNQTLYRTFSIKPWRFWEWWQYMAHSRRFALPYLETN